jgi:hypothetical protein
MNNIANFFSIVFHPLLLATYLFLLFGWLYPPALFPVQVQSLRAIIILVFVTTFVLPVLSIYFFKSFGTITSITMPTRKERIVPFLLIVVLYGIVTYLLYARTGISMQDNFMKFLLIIDALVLCSFLLTFFLKLSIHSLAIMAMVGIMIILNNSVENGIFLYPMLVSIVLAGVVMTARLQLQVHTMREVVLGAAVGLVVGMGGMIFLF